MGLSFSRDFWARDKYWESSAYRRHLKWWGWVGHKRMNVEKEEVQGESPGPHYNREKFGSWGETRNGEE